MAEQNDVRVPVALYFDYICPFCYVADARLDRVRRRYPVAVQYRFIEIHPDNPAEGRPVEDLGYPPEQWRAMNENLRRMVAEDGLEMAERTFTTNSRRALLLAQAVFEGRPERFLDVHRAIFRAYFVDRRNIGDPEVLVDLARTHGVADLAERAWSEQHYLTRLLEHVEAAQALQLTGVPTLVVDDRPFTGAVSVETLEQALQQHGDAGRA
ncbi:DsbA family protein [Ectothiorhodospiraceae bacterium WFHF3C12]|nr:DsbA family protein [Ectothiorhodospiraceae bacterium WFHF3C12]